MNNVAVKTENEMSLFNTPDLSMALQLSGKLAASTIIPRDYQNNPANCLVAIEMANRLKASPMMVMQNLYVINGRPAWSAQWLVAMINKSKKYKYELQYEIGHDKQDGGLSCYAWTEDYNNHKVVGPKITMTMANAEGWTGKNGSKWKTMPEVMIRYRAASFFARLNCPDMVMGIYEENEVIEMTAEVKEPVYTSYEAANVNVETGEITMQAETNIEPETADFGSEDKIISTAARKEIFKAIRETGTDDPNKALKAVLKEFGYTSTQGILEKDYEAILERIKGMVKQEPETTEEPEKDNE